MNKPVYPVVIIGCGDIGTQVAQHYLDSQANVLAIVRTAASAGRLNKLGIQAVALDLAAEFHFHFDLNDRQVFYFAPPPSTGTQDTHTTHLINALQQDDLHPQRIVYISTTGVYGDCQGRWIDEDEPVNPQADRAKRRLDAEQQLLDYSKRSGVDVVILRVAGIYGPGKLPLERIRQRKPVIRPVDSPFTNRIHSTDLVNIAVAAMKRGKNAAIYHACDGHPGTMADYFKQVARKAGLPQPPEISLSEGVEKLSPGMMSYMMESRRLRNTKTLKALKVKLQYPTLQTGLEHCGL